jgi:ribosomal protein S6
MNHHYRFTKFDEEPDELSIFEDDLKHAEQVVRINKIIDEDRENMLYNIKIDLAVSE